MVSASCYIVHPKRKLIQQMNEKLKGKRALVTAGAQGIGLAISRGLLNAGCTVVVHYFSSADTANELKKEYDDRVEVLQADLTDPAQTKEMVGKAIEKLGRLEILINNAGSLIARKRLEEIETDFWQTVIDVNVTSMINVTKFASPRPSRGWRCGDSQSWLRWPVERADTLDRWLIPRPKVRC